VTVLDRPPTAARSPSLAEMVRPFSEEGTGITFLDGDRRRRVGYRELAGLAAGIAARLHASGVRPADRVAVFLGNDLGSVATLLGIWAAGATVVSVPDTAMRGAAQHVEHFGSVLRSAECAFCVGDEAAAALAGSGGLKLIPAASLRGAAALTGPALGARALDADLDGLGLIQFTSGSISAPKGVALSAAKLAGHAGMSASVAAIDPDRDRIVSWLPLYHDMGLITVFLTALAARADLVLLHPASFAFGPARWIRTIAAERGTLTAAPNFAYHMAASVPYGSGLDLSQVRISLSGGERIRWSTLVDFHRVFAPYGFGWEALTPVYGLAESTVGTTWAATGAGPARGPGDQVCVGTPVPGMSVQAPDGPVPGPIRIRGRWVFDGYFTADGYEPMPAGEWYDTGDEGFIHEGGLYVQGRRAEVVAAAGRNVFAEDIEVAVHDAGGTDIRACAAFRLDESEQQFGVMIELPVGARHGPAEISAIGHRARAAVSAAIGIRVNTVVLVRPGTIPKTTSGKVQRARCRTLHAAGLGRKLLATLD
jgi:acyl-CoA synthetase (AMP-forming)/AMP-acid ligase II